MLTLRRPLLISLPPRARQAGVVLIIALIVLVAMMLAALGLIRSVDTTTLVAGNLAFQQSATHSADAGVEAAIKWIEGVGSVALQNDDATNGYAAAGNQFVPSSATSETWDHFWMNTLNSRAVQVQGSGTGGADVAANKVYYVIDRLCDAAGSVTSGAACIRSPVVSTSNGMAEEGGEPQIASTSTMYYRITVRVVGPKNTVSYVQTVVAM